MKIFLKNFTLGVLTALSSIFIGVALCCKYINWEGNFRGFILAMLIVIVFMGFFCGGLLSLSDKSSDVFNVLEQYEKKIIILNTIDELNKFIDDLQNYKVSKNCFSIHHMQEANKIIFAAKIKIDTIKQLQG